MTLRTEEEARQFVCPFLPCGREPVRSAIKVSGPVSVGLSPTKCITSLCAMWEWEVAQTTPYPPRGYCALKTVR